MWDVKGSFGAPVRLVALGLGLYKWRPPVEFDQWAADVLRVLDGLRSAPAAAMPVAA